MSIEPSTEFEPARTADLWIYVPAEDDIVDLDAWTAANVTGWGHATGADTESLDRLEAFLRRLVAADRLKGYPHRFVFLIDPGFGATVFDVALGASEPGLSLIELLSTGDGGSLGVDTDDFMMNGIAGVQEVRFDLDGTPDDPERAISAVATTAVLRTFADVGELVVLARCATTQLESLATALLPLQFLLTSDEIDELVRRTG